MQNRKIRVRVYFSGSVQGVGLREKVKEEAKKRNIAGWVKNLPVCDGKVEAIFEGEFLNILGLFTALRAIEGVSKLESQREKVVPAEFSIFDIR